MKIFWGDIHNHCNITYGYGSLENALLAAKKQLDFCSITPHAMWPDIPAITPESEYLVNYHKAGFDKIKKNWHQIKRIIENANQDGEFVTFHSFEMHHSKLGDHHIISPDALLELIYADTPHDAVNQQICSAIAIPHHIAYTPGYRSIDWWYFDESVSPIVEVYSKHGCALKDDGNFNYYHTMGPRDSRATAYTGLRQGKRFGFAASTDHHAGFPGSYGDGKLAVLADSKTRASIWEAILAGRTYAVTGDKIQCAFTLNGTPLGGKIPTTNRRVINFSVEGSDAIDKIVLYRNLEPICVINGELLPISNKDNRFKVRLELGWGSDDDAYLWECTVHAKGGRIIDLEPCIRGRSILAPSPKQKDDPNINKLISDIRFIDDTNIEFDCETYKNLSTTHPQTSAIVLEVEGSCDTCLDFNINGQSISLTVDELLKGSVTGQVRSYASPSFRIHGAVPRSRYYVNKTYVEERTCEHDFYHLEVQQRNGCAAYVTPVYMV